MDAIFNAEENSGRRAPGGAPWKRASSRALFRLGVRQKMVLVLLTVLTVALTATGWLSLREQQRDILQETQRRGEDISRFVSQSLAFSVVGYDYHTIQLLLNEIVKAQDIAYAKVMSAKGNVMGEAGSGGDEAQGRKLFHRDITMDGTKVGELVIGLDSARIVRQMENQKDALIKREALIIILIALGEFLALSYVIVRPVSLISTSLSESIDGSGRITRDIPLRSGDEFGELARQFNTMRHQLNEANERLQSKIDLADAKLKETNEKLQRQSEELRQMNNELKKISVTDPLTGLYNRRYFEELVDKELALSLRHRESSSLLVIDIDHFKSVNDTYGHKAGDAVLRGIAALFSGSLRRSDMLCRVGGEEFVVLCRRADKNAAIEVAEKLRRAAAEHRFDVERAEISVTISAGIASVPEEADIRTVEDYFKHADQALYYCKQNGRNRVVHYTDIVAS